LLWTLGHHTISPIKIHKTIILPLVLYGQETWSLTLREEHRLRVFENWVRRRIFGPKRDEVTGSWRKLHIEELHGLYSSPSIIRMIKARRMRWAGHVAHMGGLGVHTTFCLGGMKGGDHWEDLGINGRITLRWILGK
jgi:hypothetical protein